MKTKSFIEMAKQTDLLVVTGDIGAAYGTTSFRARKAFQVNPIHNRT
jgi:hypothetical protein